MPNPEHGHPGQNEPRSHGQTHHEDRVVDINTAPEEVLADLPMVGEKRAKALIQARPFKSWDEIANIEGFSMGMIDDLKSGGVQLGSP